LGEITLIRHGQANSSASDEDGYDRLSDLGRQQSVWLGEWLRAHERPFDRVLAGALRRHRETAAAMGDLGAPVETDPRLNEIDYFNLAHALRASQGVPLPGPDAFAEHAPRLIGAWHRAEIMGQETFAAFEDRVTAVLQEAAEPGRRVICITSGGVIGMVMRHLLRLDPGQMAHVLLPIRNSSVHRIQVMPYGTLLSGFNATPHLDPPERARARTHF